MTDCAFVTALELRKESCLMTPVQPFCTTAVTFCTKDELQNDLLSLPAHSLLLVMSESSAARWDFGNWISCLRETYSLNWLMKVPANPTQRDILASLNSLKEIPQCIVAIGGGSAIDLAKGIALFADMREHLTVTELTESIKWKKYLSGTNKNTVPIIAVPTTAGTGSEVTQWATVWDTDRGCKYSIDSPELKPKRAYVVPELTLTLPAFLTLSTGLDALSHAIEAYWSKHTNPLVQDLALRSIRIILETLPCLTLEVKNGRAAEALREKQCRASLLAGLAFSQTRTTACHSISYPLTMLYDIPHGYAAAMTLAEVAKQNAGHFPGDEELFSLFVQYGGLQNWLDQTCAGVKALRLSCFGISKMDIPNIVCRAFTGGRMDNNPVNFVERDVEEILNRLL